MKIIYILAGYVLLVVSISVMIHSIGKSAVVDNDTKMLCKEYAARDHRGEIAPERYEWLGKDFVNSYDWYNSCINHIRYPVL